MAQPAVKTAVPDLPQKTLHQKLLSVMEQVTYIQKKGRNTFHGYNYATEADVAEAVRAALITERLLIVPHLLSRASREITTSKGKTEYVTSVRVQYTVHDCDSKDVLVFEMEGDGQDPGDKGIFKAITGCTKYALMKLLHIPTGDDPEGDSKTDEAHAAESAAAAPRITAAEADTLMNEITKQDRSIDAVCKHYKVKSLVELTAAQCADAWQRLGKKEAV